MEPRFAALTGAGLYVAVTIGIRTGVRTVSPVKPSRTSYEKKKKIPAFQTKRSLG